MNNLLLSRRSFMRQSAAAAIGLAAAAGAGGLVLASSALAPLADGISSAPSDWLTWRLVRDKALPGSSGPTLARALGFVLAHRADLRITTIGDGFIPVAKGTGHFVAEDILERHASASDKAVRYLRFGLVEPSEAEYTAGGSLLFGSDAQMFRGDSDIHIRLFKGRLSGNRTVTLPVLKPNGTIVYADHGSIAVIGVAEDGTPVGPRFDLAPGEAVVPTVADKPPHHWIVAVADSVKHVLFYVASAEAA